MDASVCVVCWVRVSNSINCILFMWLSETPLPMSVQVNSARSCTRSLTIFVREHGGNQSPYGKEGFVMGYLESTVHTEIVILFSTS